MKAAISLLLAALGAVSASPPVNVALRSSWPAPPFLAEILETVSLEYPDAFFTYLERITDPDFLSIASSATPEAVHQAALALAVDEVVQDADALATIQMKLAMHSATPKLEAFYNYYEDNHKASSGTRCGSWVDWYGDVVCDVETLAQLVGTEAIDAPDARPLPKPKLLTLDHIYPPPNHILERPPRTAILYASLTSPNFRELHEYLQKVTNRLDTHVEYIFRHIPPTTPSTTHNYLSGYGVALDLKKMDYLALDDRNQGTGSTTTESQEEQVDEVARLILSHPENPTAPDASVPLSEEELVKLGQQAVQIVASSDDPLSVMTQLAHNFPKYTTSLARRVIVNESITEEIHKNSLKAEQGTNMFWFNGLTIEGKDVTPFNLLRVLKKEKEVMASLVRQGLKSKEAFELLTHPTVAQKQNSRGRTDTLFDASDRPEGGDIIVWWNDMEKDSRYQKWSPSLYALLRPMYPGAMPMVRANLFNVVLLFDLSQMSTLNFIAGPVSTIIARELPLRFGLIPLTETEEGKKMAKLFYHIVKNHGRKRTLEFIKAISQVQVAPQLQARSVDWNTVDSAYEHLLGLEKESKPDETFPTLKSILEAVDSPAPFDKISAYSERLGTTLAVSPGGHAFFNGKHLVIDDTQEFLRALQNEMSSQMNILQEKVYEGSLGDTAKPESMSNYFYDLPDTAKRRNQYIYPSNAPGSLRIANLPDLFKKTRFSTSPASYLYHGDFAEVAQSLYVVADLDSEGGLELAKEAVLSLTAESKTRIAFIHNPKNPKAATHASISWLFSHLHNSNLLSKARIPALLDVLGVSSPVAQEDTTQIPIGNKNPLEELTDGVPLDKIPHEEYADYVKLCRLLSRELKIEPGHNMLVVNGRVVGPIRNNDFRAADFQALEEYEYKKRSEAVEAAIISLSPAILSDKYTRAEAVSMAVSVISSSQQPDPSEIGLFDAPVRPRQTVYKTLDKEYTGFEFGDAETAIYRVALVVDPLSETGQKWAGIAKWLSNIPGMFIEIHLNPGRYKQLPLKRFYRYNLVPSLTFNENGQEIPAGITFENIPVDPIYTLAMDVPSSWLVRPREALYDLDNIQLGKLFPGDNSVDAVFALDYIVIEGHAREVSGNGGAPRGVQLQLTASDGSAVDDTLVAANLGYIQFKAKPGVFNLEIRPGRGRKIFRLDSAGNEGWDSPSVEEVGSGITLTSFEGMTLYPRISRLPGMETADVLKEDAADEQKGLFDDISSKFKSMFSSKKESSNELVTVKPQADINIFTVASGLLYERFVGIMILSVMRNTNSSVKFWFIENFLSPSFLEFIPHMAEKYNFQYELVTYKWPSWLRAQTEKQRIIWAYKILFLDVLFPMDLKKVIFVDADQIVRADLKELVDLDLQGAPYGYTPMGDDNTDMEGFRFWKTGYWKDYLRGRPYHISALYVIDLVRFRELAAGDILRGQYHGLSADPNSLANLDQDLPNNLQEHVPIFSLHEDWLWCETWCSKDRLHRAKTIDLCQNPLTKEPKLARARQIPEWEEYDSEIARFTRELAAEGKIHSRIATADTNILAGGGASGGAAADSKSEDKVVPSSDEKQGDHVRDEL